LAEGSVPSAFFAAYIPYYREVPMKLSRPFLAAWLTITFVVPCAQSAVAQSEIIPKEVEALFDDINDIDKLRVLNPLKLTTDQLDQIIVIVKKAQDDYNKKLADAAVPPIKEIAKEIKETRRKMLAGATIPKDFDEKVKKHQEAFVKRRNQEDFNTLKGLAEAVKKVLTKEQFTKAVSIAKDFLEKQGKEVKGEDDKFFNYYVLGTLITYPRIVPLLQDMRAARVASGKIGGYREARR
jgi:hypothetical protein